MGLNRRGFSTLVLASAASLSLGRLALAEADPLPSWNDGPAKSAIRNFVRAITDQSSQNYVAPEDRIATFDQDGTL